MSWTALSGQSNSATAGGKRGAMFTKLLKLNHLSLYNGLRYDVAYRIITEQFGENYLGRSDFAKLRLFRPYHD
jgi:hypothetical protein